MKVYLIIYTIELIKSWNIAFTWKITHKTMINLYIYIIMSEELKDTFDGYLMFDFSNFHGLMA